MLIFRLTSDTSMYASVSRRYIYLRNNIQDEIRKNRKIRNKSIFQICSCPVPTHQKYLPMIMSRVSLQAGTSLQVSEGSESPSTISVVTTTAQHYCIDRAHYYYQGGASLSDCNLGVDIISRSPTHTTRSTVWVADDSVKTDGVGLVSGEWAHVTIELPPSMTESQVVVRTDLKVGAGGAGLDNIVYHTDTHCVPRQGVSRILLQYYLIIFTAGTGCRDLSLRRTLCTG